MQDTNDTDNWVYFGNVSINLNALPEDRPRLDPEAKREWVDALWFGFYQQGRDYLFRDGSFCCLGVKQKIEGFINAEIENKFDYYGPDRCVLRGDGGLPLNCVFVSDIPHFCLANINDRGVSFREIAFVINHVF